MEESIAMLQFMILGSYSQSPLLVCCFFNLFMFILCFSIGFIFLKVDGTSFQKIVLSLAIGYIFITVALYFISFIYIGLISLMLIVFITLLMLSYVLYRKRFLYYLRPCTKYRFSAIKAMIPEYIIALISILYFNSVVINHFWPPIGDIATLHGPLVTIILYNKKLLVSPLFPQSKFSYSIGFHTLAAYVALLFKLLPAHAIYLLGEFASLLISLEIFCLAYSITDSLIVAFIIYLLSFFRIPEATLVEWIYGHFFNGTYPNIHGLLCLITFLNYTLLYYSKQEKTNYSANTIRNHLNILVIQLLFIIYLAITYPIFLPLLLLYILIEKIYRLHKTRPISPLIFIISFFILLALWLIIATSNDKIFRFIKYHAHEYTVTKDIFHRISLISYFAILSFPLFFISFYSFKNIIKRDSIYLFNLFYIVSILILIFHVHISSYLALLLLPVPSRRLTCLVTLLGYIFIFSNVYKIILLYLRNHSKNISIIIKTTRGNLKLKISIAIIILLALNAPLLVVSLPKVVHDMYDIVFEKKVYGWFPTRWSWFKHDYELLLWIKNNIPSDEIILNDYSWSSQWILSTSYKRVIFYYYWFKSEDERNNLLKIYQVWFDPLNETLVLKTISSNNIKYIVITSEPGYWSWGWFFGGRSHYKLKPYTPEEYIEIFSNYSFLKLIYRNGNSAVFRVNIGRGE